MLTAPVFFRLLYFVFARLKVDPDHMILKVGRGFSGPDLLEQVRCQPSVGLLRMMCHRMEGSMEKAVARRVRNGRYLDHALGICRNQEHTYWAYCVTVSDPDDLVAQLRDLGLDATRRTRIALRTVVEYPSALLQCPCHESSSRNAQCVP